MFDSLAFLGDLHPVAVHFPIALIPAVLLVRLYARRYRSDPAALNGVVRFLLYFTLLCAVAAVALGITNAVASGYTAEVVGTHFVYALATTLLLALACLLHQRDAFVAALGSSLLRVLRLLWRATWAVLRISAKILKWPLIILLLPLYLLWRLLRRLARAVPGQLLPRCRRALAEGARTILARCRGSMRRYLSLAELRAASLVLALLFVLLTGLEGANISRGEGHLTRNMPAWLQTVFVRGAEDFNAGFDLAYYESEIALPLRRSCIKCHGEEKQQGNLRLDSYEAVVASGVVDWRNPYGSELLRRVLLPRDHHAAMPPQDKGRELRSEHITALIDWINGHTLETLAQQNLGLPENLKRVAKNLALVEDDELAALNAREGSRVMRLVEDYDLLAVSLSFVPEARLSEALADLLPYAEHIVDLDLSGLSLTAEQWQRVTAMTNLQRLNLSRSTTSDGDLRALIALQQLQWLNVHGTAVSLSAGELKVLWPSLESVYLPQSPEKA